MSDQSFTPLHESAPSRDERDIETELDRLRFELANLKQALGDRAELIYEGASEKATRTTAALRMQAASISSTVRHNPGTVSTSFILGGLIGLFIGMAIGGAAETERPRTKRR